MRKKQRKSKSIQIQQSVKEKRRVNRLAAKKFSSRKSHQQVNQSKNKTIFMNMNTNMNMIRILTLVKLGQLIQTKVIIVIVVYLLIPMPKNFLMSGKLSNRWVLMTLSSLNCLGKERLRWSGWSNENILMTIML